jgi:WD40 repeat protein
MAWDVTTGRRLHVLAGLGRIVWVVQLSDDGRTALALADETTHVWDTATGRRMHAFPVRTDCWQAVALAKLGDIALTGCIEGNVTGGIDGKTMVWDVASGRLLRTLTGHEWKITCVAVSADSRIALTGSHDRTARLWDLQTGECLRKLDGHTAALHSVALSADAHIAVTCSSDQTIRVWKLDWD